MKKMILILALLLFLSNCFAIEYWNCSDGNPCSPNYRNAFPTGGSCMANSIDANTFIGQYNGQPTRCVSTSTNVTDTTYQNDGTVTANYTYTSNGRDYNFTDTSSASSGTINRWIWFVTAGNPNSKIQNPTNITLAYNTDYNICLIASDNIAKKYDIECKTIHTMADSIAPTTTILGCENGWNKSDQTITLSCTDDNSGCFATYYNLDAGGQLTYSSPFALSTDSNHLINYFSTDNASNSETSKASYCAIDKTSPDTNSNFDSNVWYNSSKNVVLACRDGLGSGCLVTKYRYKSLPSGSFTAMQTYSNPVVFDTEGQYQIDFNALDVAGNTSDLNTQFLFLDLSRPTITSDVGADWNLTQDQNIHLTCTDALSGVSSIKYRLDDDNSSAINYGAWISYDSNILTKKDGNLALQFFCTNGAGLDSNTTATDVNTVFILNEAGTPPTPTSLQPTTGQFTGTVNISCASSAWIRDINYFIDFNTSTLDWNNVAKNSTGSYVLDVSTFGVNETLTFRCKTTDSDKNSAYLTNTTSITVNPDTGFDSITRAQPLNPTTIYTGTLPFSLDANDVSGVKYCTFEIYKNTIKVGDFNGARPINDLNIGTWTYSYSGAANGDIVNAYVYCTDAENNKSAKISTASYSVNIQENPPGGGGGGGGGETTTNFELSTDKLTIFYSQNKISTAKISVKNTSNKTIEITLIVEGDANPFFIVDPTKKNIIESGKSKEIEVSFLIDKNVPINNSVIAFSSGGIQKKVQATFIYDQPRDFLSQAKGLLDFNISYNGIGLSVWILLSLLLGGISFFSSKKSIKNGSFVLLIIVLFFEFSFILLQALGVSL